MRGNVGVGDEARDVDVSGLWPSDVGDRGNDLSSLASAVADVVRRDLVRVCPKERGLGARVAASLGFRVLFHGVVMDAQASPGDGSPGTRPHWWARRVGRG